MKFKLYLTLNLLLVLQIFSLCQGDKDLLNIANGAVVTSQSGSFSELWDGLLILDDATETGWCSRDGSFPQIIEISLSKAYNLTKFEIDNSNAQENSYPGISTKDFELWVSADNENFERVLSEEASQGNIRSFQLNTLMTMSLRLVINSNYGFKAYTELMEVNAYGKESNSEIRARPIEGIYQTNYKKMKIKSDGRVIYGCYEHDEGKMRGTLTENVIQFEWNETGGQQIGTAIMALTDDNMYLNGLWYENGQYRGLWNGKKILNSDETVCELPSGSALVHDLEESGRVILYGILFDYDSDKIKTESYSTLDDIFSALESSASLQLYVDGHTDNLGSDLYNNELSHKRAISVIKWLVDKGIDSSRLEARGKGESQPVANNQSEQGRKLNRRVELIKK